MLKRNGPASPASEHRANLKPSRAEDTNIVAELQDLARQVRRIGCGYRTDPEAILIAKDAVASRLAALAREIGGRHV